MKKAYLLLALFLALTDNALCELPVPWYQVPNLPNSHFNSVIVDNDKIFASNASDGVYFSTDNGITWTLKNNGFDRSSSKFYLRRLYKIGNDFIALERNSGMYKSTDNGETWKLKNNGLPNDSIFLNLALNGNRIFLSTGKGICKSTDFGESWSFKELNTANEGFYALAAKDNYVYAGCNMTNYSKFFISSDYGDTWTEKTNSSSPLSVYEIIFINGVMFVTSNNSGLYYSTDNGNKWKKNEEYGNNPATFIGSSGNYVFTTFNGSFYLSTYDGSKWTNKNKWNLNNDANKISVYGDDVFVGSSGHGIYRAKISELITTDAQDLSNAADNFLSISPNPASGNVTISYPDAAAEITITNSLGMEIKRFTSSELEGQSTLNYSTETLPLGIYYCSFITGKERVTKRFVVVR